MAGVHVLYRVECFAPDRVTPALVGDFPQKSEAQKAGRAIKRDRPGDRVTLTKGAEVPPTHTTDPDGNPDESAKAARATLRELGVRRCPAHEFGQHFAATDEPEEIG